MGREVRRVPKDWQHPKNSEGRYIPMHEDFPYDDEEIKEGLEDGWLNKSLPNYGLNIMPDWEEEKRTHYQMYETCTQGTPISPVCETPEELARWLADNEASSFGLRTATYEQWLRICKGKPCISAVIVGNEIISGVEAKEED